MIWNLSLMTIGLISVVIWRKFIIGGIFRNSVRVIVLEPHLISHGLNEDEAEANKNTYGHKYTNEMGRIDFVFMSPNKVSKKKHSQECGARFEEDSRQPSSTEIKVRFRGSFERNGDSLTTPLKKWSIVRHTNGGVFIGGTV
jgi:hypothetical protein